VSGAGIYGACPEGTRCSLLFRRACSRGDALRPNGPGSTEIVDSTFPLDMCFNSRVDHDVEGAHVTVHANFISRGAG
jgi:hypothetical protein